MMEFLSGLSAEQVVTALSTLVAILSVVRSFFVAIRSDKDAAEALLLAVNVLKDEGKMVDGRFSDATMKKLQQVSDILGVGLAAKSKVEEVISSGSEVKDVRVASINGKKIYLSDLAKIGSIAKVAREAWIRIRK